MDVVSEPGKGLQRWADAAMFRAEPMDTEGPQVYLLSAPPDPLGSIAAACKMYKGEVVRDLGHVTDNERRAYLQQVRKTKLQAPFEFVYFHFLIDGVTRAFTHQLVRQRTAAYAQESLRFAVKEDMPVGLPPSLAGTLPHIPGDERDEPFWSSQSKAQHMRQTWDETLAQLQAAYDKLINSGMPAEDARGLLPHNVLTRVHYTTNLRSLLDHSGNRLCTQAQFEWRIVFAKIAQAIRNYGEYKMYKCTTDTDEHAVVRRNALWQFMELSEMFAPVCYATGKCEFMADFDRPCAIRAKVEANHAIGRPSSEWDKPKWDCMASPGTCEDPENCGNGVLAVQAIQPSEWLLNPGAAR